ncbi:MAG: transglutaminase family protein [Pirellulales bacterium]
MLRLSWACLAACVLLCGPKLALAEEPAPPPAERTVAELAQTARESIVVVRHAGRDGGDQGLGTGFIISADGLIATNLHVIGEGRTISVETAAGKRYDVVSVQASDRAHDLAIVKIDAADLPLLELGDSASLADGQPVVALGNPQGLERSVVSGVVSGRRDIEGQSMIQLAIPIEPGNSGGPLLDMQGRVHGILTMKSLVTPNLGFAVAINNLKPLLEKPNPIEMSRWLTIGALDAQDWQPLFGGRWRQRAGRILVDGNGQGLGGRSLCLSQRPVPEAPFEVAVWVKLADEAGAAGLAFHADGQNKHYGFYPSKGHMRLARFEGSDVYSWTVLHDEPSPHYRAGEWNHLKVRVEADLIRCFVNDQLVVESKDNKLAPGKVGLAQFRGTSAQFKRFQVGNDLPAARPPAEETARVSELVAELALDGPPAAELVANLTTAGSSGANILRERAVLLERQAAQLKRLAVAVHQQQTLDEFASLLAQEDSQLDLAHAALLIARLDNDEVDVASYRQDLDRLAADVRAAMPADADEAGKLLAMNKLLFEQLGFHGSRGDYYNKANSYLNEVLDDREGLPITLSLLYMELARRADLNVVGLGWPGHFVVRHIPAEGDPRVVDVWDNGKVLDEEAVTRRVQEFAGREPLESDFVPIKKRMLLKRMLHNLLGLASQKTDREAILPYLDAIALVDPEAVQERWFRAVVRFQTGRNDAALEDARWVEAHIVPGIDPAAVQQLIREIEK